MKSKIISLIALITLISCSENSSPIYNDSPKGNTGTGLGGSMARFAVSGNFLYTVDNQSLNVFDVSNPLSPAKTKDVNVGFGIETIFPMGNTLFLGTQTGMYIFDITDPLNIKQKSHYNHIYSCDPVVADGNYAYVTLSSNSRCGRWVNQLDIVDISDLNHPYLLKSYNMTNPQGLGIDSTTLFICDDGLKVYDVSNKNNIILKKHYNNIAATDVIPLKGLLLVIGNNGLYQYQYNKDTVFMLSTIDTY